MISIDTRLAHNPEKGFEITTFLLLGSTELLAIVDIVSLKSSVNLRLTLAELFLQSSSLFFGDDLQRKFLSLK